MKHAAVMIPPTILHEYPIYSSEQTTPTGTYHWVKSINHKPPTLTKITRIEWYEAEMGDIGGVRKRIVRGRHVTIWKHGWHHIKGARKKAQEKAKRA